MVLHPDEYNTVKFTFLFSSSTFYVTILIFIQGLLYILEQDIMT